MGECANGGTAGRRMSAPQSECTQLTGGVAVQTVIITVAVGFAAGPPVYYAVVDVIRRREVRRRRKRYTQRTGRTAPFLSPVQSQEDKEALKELYASFKIAGRFSNPFVEWREQSFWEVLLWKLVYTPLSGRFLFQGGKPSDPDMLRQSLPTERPNFVKLFGLESKKSIDDSWDHLSLPDRPGSSSSDDDVATRSRPVKVSSDLTYTWIGQSTSFVQLEGVSILTDPIFDERTLPTVFAPARLFAVPCQVHELLAIDIVLVSHNHPDHISVASVKNIGNRAKWIIPLGLGKWLSRHGVTNWIEMNWWQELVLTITTADGAKKTVTVCCTPAMHWSARGLFDSNLTLWASFVVKGNKDSFFHASVFPLSWDHAGSFRPLQRRHGLLRGLQGNRAGTRSNYAQRTANRRVRATVALVAIFSPLEHVARLTRRRCNRSKNTPHLALGRADGPQRRRVAAVNSRPLGILGPQRRTLPQPTAGPRARQNRRRLA